MERLREMLGKNADNISILEHQVDFAVQMEYYDLANGLESPEDMESLPEREQELYDTNIDLEQKKKLLVSIARIEKPEAYRVLQRFLPLAPPELKEWAIMAYQESRILLETHLLGGCIISDAAFFLFMRLAFDFGRGKRHSVMIFCILPQNG